MKFPKVIKNRFVKKERNLGIEEKLAKVISFIICQSEIIYPQ